MKRNISLLFYFLLLLSPLASENLRGFVSGINSLNSDETPSPISLKLDELAFFDLQSDNPFLQGIELTVEIPRDLQEYRNSFALFLYKDISPLPNLRERDFRGSRVIMHILPSQNLLSIKIPLYQNHSLVKDATSVVTATITEDQFPIGLTLLPIMKGIPDRTYTVPLTISLKPIFKNQGGLRVNLENYSDESSEKVQLFLDGKEIELSNEMIPLAVGMHSLVISSSSSIPQEYSIPIEEGKVFQLSHSMELQPVSMEIPPYDGIRFFIDGEEFSSGISEFLPGEHKLKIEINESLSIEDTIFLASGEDKILDLDININLRKKSE